jgi:hypothetical protein
MKTKIAFILVIAALWFGCKNEPDYKVVRQQVMDHHDQLMIDGEIAIKNKMQLDTLSNEGLKKLKLVDPTLDTLKEKQQIASLIQMLNKADEHMMDWMHDFQADIGQKNNAQAVAYFNGEKTKLNTMDSLYRIALKQSDDYLKRFK